MVWFSEAFTRGVFITNVQQQRHFCRWDEYYDYDFPDITKMANDVTMFLISVVDGNELNTDEIITP